jgi:hypothetical protein
MVVAEIALSVVLVAGGGLLIRSFVQVQGAGVGFEPASVITAKIALGDAKYKDEALRRRYWEDLRRELARHSALQSAGLVWPIPFTGQGAEVPYDSAGSDAPEHRAAGSRPPRMSSTQ